MPETGSKSTLYKFKFKRSLPLKRATLKSNQERKLSKKIDKVFFFSCVFELVAEIKYVIGAYLKVERINLTPCCDCVDIEE